MNDKKNPYQIKNPLEALRELSSSAATSFRKDLLSPMPAEFGNQIFGGGFPEKNFSGEIVPGESLEIREVYSGRRQEYEVSESQRRVETTLLREENILIERRLGELRLRIQSIHQEIKKVVEVTPKLTREIQIAALQAPVSASDYDLNMLDNIWAFIRNFRKNAQQAQVWLSAANKRASKKNMWGQNYKKYGAKYLLSGEHYASRSAA
jgi:hypothetical protein